MLPIILHSKEVGASRDFVAANPDKTIVDWFDLDARSALLTVIGEVTVRGVPSVLISYPAWFKPEAFYGDERVDYPAGFETIYEPESWEDVEDRIAFVNSRTRGYLPDIDIPDADALVWGEVPEPPEGKVTVFDGWDVEDNVARRRWRFEDAPEQEFEEDTNVNNDDE